MKRNRRLIKKFVAFCKNNLKKELKSIFLYGSSTQSIQKAKDIDIIVVIDDKSNKTYVYEMIEHYVQTAIKLTSKESIDLPFTKINESDFFNITVTTESELKSKNLRYIFNNKYLVSFFVPTSLVLLSLKQNHKVLFGDDYLNSYKIKITFFDYIKTLTRSLTLSILAILIIPLSLTKSFSLACDSLKHLLQNVFILETGTFAPNINEIFMFYNPSWWVGVLSDYRHSRKIGLLDKVKFIFSLPFIIVVIFMMAFL